jgi:hypothetical protein
VRCLVVLREDTNISDIRALSIFKGEDGGRSRVFESGEY